MTKKNENLNQGVRTSDYMPIEEYKRLLKCLDDDKKYFWETYVLLQFSTGLRISDVRKLTWAEMLRSKFNISETKTGKVREIFIADPEVEDLLFELYKKMGEPDLNEVILSTNNTCNKGKNTAVSSQYINRTIKKWKTEYHIDIENFSTHTFRKTFGRRVYDAYEDGDKMQALILLSEIFHHSSINVTKRYLGIRKDEIKKCFAHLLTPTEKEKKNVS